MADDKGAEECAELSTMQHIGDGAQMLDQIVALVAMTVLFHEFDRAELRILARFMKLYRVEKGQAILHEGQRGDVFLLLVEGKVEVFKQDIRRRQKHIATVTPGQTVGEMAIVDGEPRSATCITAEPCTFAVLRREDLVRLIDEHPRLGSKILIQILELMGQRLRQTGGILVNYLKVD
ncbi:MAG: cyclic nucleotide-binding domain-containing protein [Pseudomonadota bacterium]